MRRDSCALYQSGPAAGEVGFHVAGRLSFHSSEPCQIKIPGSGVVKRFQQQQRFTMAPPSCFLMALALHIALLGLSSASYFLLNEDKKCFKFEQPRDTPVVFSYEVRTTRIVQQAAACISQLVSGLFSIARGITSPQHEHCLKTIEILF